MTNARQRSAAKKFAAEWKGRGYEKGESHSFWLSLLRNVYGIEESEQFIRFEEKVIIDHTSFVDAIIPATKVLIEQKSLGKSLTSPIRQSDGSLLTPFQQAKKYIAELPLSQHPRWVVTCNFKSFLVYDMERPGGEPEEILLENLEEEYFRLAFLVDTGNENLKREMEVSIAAGEIVGLLYDAFAKEYIDPDSERAQKSLNILCVRLVFCLYAEDAGLFGRKAMFRDYLAGFEMRHLRKAIIDLFHILDTRPEDRDPYLDPALAAFPYVNGGLFEYEDIEIPQCSDEIRELLIHHASKDFNWSQISPTIFGAVFESTLNPETRRSGGMHYTSLENIHRVIDPLFCDGLNKEFADICDIAVTKTKLAKLREFQKKLASLSFFDPACGSGNFLTETYLSIRRLENLVLNELQQGQQSFTDAAGSPIQVSIGQFSGIEINDFAVTVAKTALWIAESQMMRETEDIVRVQLDYLPLKSYANIVWGNALRMDWEDVFPKHKADYIMGNPPFVGARMMSPVQKNELLAVFGKLKGVGNLDYVTAWYKKAADFMRGSQIRAAFVSTNSITQGEQPAILWKAMMQGGIHINFGIPTFKWNSEATDKAAVHCVIIGFSHVKTERTLNQYLLDAPTVFIESRTKPLCDVPEISLGNQPIDGGNYLFTAEEKDEFIRNEPQAGKWFRPWVGSHEFVNNYYRYFLFLKNCPPSELKLMPESVKRIKAVRNFRLNSTRQVTRTLAERPTDFAFTNISESDYIIIPEVSSEKRRYIPIGFLHPDILCSNLVKIIPNASLYHFGILTSNVHMAWVRTVCGRLKSDYRYSGTIVYNNFPWPDVTDGQKREIEELAQGILDARKKYPDSSLADMYGETSMLYHAALLTAHQTLDRAVMKLYGFRAGVTDEAACVAALLERYEKLVGGRGI